MKLLEKPDRPAQFLGGVTRTLVEEELNRILGSDSFRESRRSKEFLRYVVTLALDGRHDLIKERTIGIEVFGRDPSYCTSDDSIVRVKASEVRRRLTQYHSVNRTDQRVRIDLAAGSYVPEISWIEPPLKEQAPVSASFRWRWAIGAVLMAALLATVFIVIRPARSGHARFWAPVIGNQENHVLICLGHPVVYLLSKRLQDEYKATRGGESEPGPQVIPLRNGNLDASDIIPVTDQFVGVGDAQAAVQLSNMLTSWGRPSQTRMGNDVSFSELRHGTVILIGAYSNRWTLRLLGELRFVFDYKNGVKVILDRSNPERTWSPPKMPMTGKVEEDYALVSRVFDAKSGQIVISAAGITQYGCQAAAEFLRQPEYLDRATESLPADWPKRNLQFVIRTKVIGVTAGAPELIDKHAQ